MTEEPEFVEAIELIEHRASVAITRLLGEPNGVRQLFRIVSGAQGGGIAKADEVMEHFVAGVAMSQVDRGPDVVDAVIAAAAKLG